MKDSIVKCPLSKSLVSFFILSSRLCILHFLGHGCPLELSASLALANEVDYPTPVFINGKCVSKHGDCYCFLIQHHFPMLIGEPKFHSWGRCTIALTSMHSDLRFNPSSGLCINLYYIHITWILYWGVITTPQDAHQRLVLQVYLGLNTLEFSAIHIGRSFRKLLLSYQT